MSFVSCHYYEFVHIMCLFVHGCDGGDEKDIFFDINMSLMDVGLVSADAIDKRRGRCINFTVWLYMMRE